MKNKHAKHEDDGPLLPPPGIYEYHNRPARDRGWALVYLIFLGLTIAGGIYGLMHRNPIYGKAMREGYMDDPSHCPLDGGARRRLLEAAMGAEFEFDLGEFFHTAGRWLLASAGLSLLAGALFLRLMATHAGVMIRIAVAFQILLPLLSGVGLTAGYGLAAGGGLLLLSAIAALAFYVWRDFFGLAARLLSMAAEGLNANLALIGFVLVGQLALLGLLAPIAVLGAVGWTNGEVASNPERDFDHGGHHHCVSADGDKVPCCVWAPDAWVAPWLSLVALTVLWTTFLAFTVRLFVISGTIAQWYFSAASLAASTRGALGRSVKHALSASFGSLCLGSAVLTSVEVLRSAADRSRTEGSGNIFAFIANCIFECIASLIEFITKFAVVRLAITGEAFFDAGRSATDLLRRNFLKSVGVWWFPGLVLGSTAVCAALAWGGAAFGAGYLAWGGGGKQGFADSVVLGVLCGLLALLVLTFLNNVLLDCVDAVYLCYAMDKDTGAETRPEAHQVFSQVPGLFNDNWLQPGGTTYGQPVSQQPGQGYYTPPTVQRAAHTGAVV